MDNKRALKLHDQELASNGLKQCRGPCHKVLAFEEFDRDESKPDKYKAWCKECRKARREAKTKSSLDETLAKIDDNLLAALRDSQPGGTNIPHQVQALEEIMSLLGGASGFAMYYTGTMLAAPPGSQTRERMLNKLLALVQSCSDDGKVSKPRELMTDEELEASIKQRAQRLGLGIIEPTDVRESA